MPVTNATIGAVNGLTARWAATADGGTVFSAAGVWPLLAFLADGATGRARAELAQALGVPAGQAASAARELTAVLETVEGLDCALGLWTQRTVELREAWEAGLPAEAHGVLTGDLAADQRALDAWAAKRTGGRIAHMPVESMALTQLVLASAPALRTDWEVPFEGHFCRWLDRFDRAGLAQDVPDIDVVAVARADAGAVTRVVVRGVTGVDVHLLLGEERMTPGEVLGAGTNVLAGTLEAVPGSRLPEGDAGPGLTVRRLRTFTPEPPSLRLLTVEFTLAAEHDLRAHPELFGLATAALDAPGHFPFPAISPAPLVVRSARQAMTATFSAEGFRATAVTTMGLGFQGRSPEEPPYETTRALAVIDRPFGFLAVHRETRLTLAAGWVTDPTRRADART